jgi:lysozyme
MKLSDRGVLEIAEHEGVVLGPYLDSVGVWTYGVGHTAAAGFPDPAKLPREDTRGWNAARVENELISALRLFDDDLDKYEARVEKAIKVPLKQHEFDALVSFDFNTGGIFKAKLTEAINRGDKSGEGFMGWVKPKEIIKRRQAEQALFRTGEYDANGDKIPVYDALPDGRIRHRMTISGARLRELMPLTSAIATPKPVDDSPALNPIIKPQGKGWIASIIDAIVRMMKGK